MSLPKRRIEIDPETPVRTLTEMLTASEEEIEIRIGPHLLVVHRSSDETAEGESVSAGVKRDATDRLLAGAGAWKDLVDGAALKRYVYDMRGLDPDLERTRRPFNIS